VTLHPNMNAEITDVQKCFLNLFQATKAYLNRKSNQFLVDLQHEAEELRRSGEFSIRAAAEINYAAATLILEERGRK
jgi:hypothetical protein